MGYATLGNIEKVQFLENQNVQVKVILKEVAAIECDFSLNPMEKKRTIDDRMKLYPGFDGISKWLYKHGLEA